MKGKLILAIGGGLLLGMAGVVNADTPSNTDLQAQIKALQDQVAQLQGQQDGAWLNEQRAEQVKAMVKDVLADADTRASLVGTGATAGFNGTNFFLASDDGMMSLKIWGLIQVAYIANFRNHPEDAVNATGGGAGGELQAAVLGLVGNINSGNQGFRISRAQIFFDGTIGPPQFLYSVGVQADKSNEDDTLYRAWIGYQFQDIPLLLKFGEDFAPFMHESLVYEGYTLTADKSLVNQIFGLDKVQGIWLEYDQEMFKLTAALHDGSHSGVAQAALAGAALAKTFGPMVSQLNLNNLTAANLSNLVSGLASGIGAIGVNQDFDNTGVDIAVTGRADIKLMGTWAQYKELASMADDDAALFLGAAFDYEKAKTGAAVADDQAYMMSWTADTTFKFKGLSVFGSVTGAYQHVGYDVPIRGGGTAKDFSNYGTVLQAGYLLPGTAIEPFARWEYIDIDTRATSAVAVPDVHILTFGANYYFKRQAAKLTCEVVWAPTSLSYQATGFADMTQEGLLTDYANHTGQVAVIFQFQLMF